MTTADKRQANGHYEKTIQQVVSRDGWDLESLSREHPTLVIFLRHLGCVYCRESLAELGRLRGAIEAKGVRIALVHMGTDEQARSLLEAFELDDVARFSDPECRLYGAFGLERTTMGNMLKPKNVFDMIKTSVVSENSLRRSVGKIIGDVLQMPGVFLMRDGKIMADFRPSQVTERADFLEMAALEC